MLTYIPQGSGWTHFSIEIKEIDSSTTEAFGYLDEREKLNLLKKITDDYRNRLSRFPEI